SSPVVLDFDPGRSDAIISVSTRGKPIGVRMVNGHVVIPKEFVSRGDNTFEIVFHAGDSSLNRNPDFMYALFVPARAHEAFPCFDQPDLKARYDLALTVPQDWVAVSNGAETSRVDTEDRLRVIRFAETQPISTYLFTFATGKFYVETAERN